jgi:release factor glutamine methyltransferase
MEIKKALKFGQETLKTTGIKTALLDSEVLLCFVTKKTREFFYTYPDSRITTQQITKFKSLIKKRATHYPIAYIVKHKEFYNLDFYVNSHVLVPRPETELLVEETITLLKTNPTLKTIAEIGTGSGCVTISILKNINKKITAFATDICKRALKIATKNAINHKVNIKFLQGNLYQPLNNKKIDILISNPPYLDTKNKNLLHSSNEKALKHEPSKALYAGKLGLDKYTELFQQIETAKNKPKYILIEIGHSQAKYLKELVEKHLPNSKITTKKDLAKRNRVMLIKLDK